MAAILGQALQVAGQIVPADHVEHGGTSPPARNPRHFRDEVSGLVVDGKCRANLHRSGAFVIAAAGDDDRQAEQSPQRDGHGTDSAGPAVDKHCVSLDDIGPLEQIGPHREQCFRQRRCVQHRQRRGNRQALADRRRTILGIAAAGHQRAHRLADQFGRDILANRHDLTGDFEAENRGRAGRRRIGALALQHIGPVDPGSRHPDQHFAFGGHRNRALHRHQHLGPSGD